MMEAEERPLKLRKIENEHDIIASSSEIGTSLRNDAAPSKPVSSEDANAAAFDSVTRDEHESSDEQAGENPNEVSAEDGNATTQPLSKNQQKKIRKRQEWEAGRDFRKERRRQKIKERKTRRRQERQEQDHTTADPTPRRPRRHVRVPVAIVIDCGFDSYMVEKEKISLGSQLTRSYSDNTKAPFQSHFYVSSWGKELKERFETVLQGHYKNWMNVTFTEKDFIEAADMAREAMTNPVGRDRVKGGVAARMEGVFEKYAEAEKQRHNPSLQQNGQTKKDSDNHEQDNSIHANEPVIPETTNSCPLIIPESAKESIIYLTSESPHTLNELLPYHTYIVGGIVDKNRHKGLCYKTACDQGVKTAKLPIGEYLTMQTRSVLATNHVVEIMLKWLELGDWGEAFMKVMPSRKKGELKTKENSAGEEDGAETDEEEEHAQEVDDVVEDEVNSTSL